VTGVKAPVAKNVWIVLPPDDVTRPPLNTCEPAYEMITVPEPPEPDRPPPPPPEFGVPEAPLKEPSVFPLPPPPEPPLTG